jgi:hypothetical protein
MAVYCGTPADLLYSFYHFKSLPDPGDFGLAALRKVMIFSLFVKFFQLYKVFIVAVEF